jgi:spore coat protein A
MWYHDHAVGITRLNAYAGLAAGYFLVDGDETRMFGAGGSVLPNQIPGIPLVLQDKSFKNQPDQWGGVGDLWYPSSYGPPDGPATLPMPTVSCVPEFFGDTPVINGMAYPKLTLPAGVHRFQLLNGTQSRVWNLQLYRESVANPGDADKTRKGPDFIQIGTEGGYLPAPAVVSSGNPFDIGKYLGHDTSGYGLVLAGAERADVLIDFSECAGQSFILFNDAPSPFPSGEEANDYFSGSATTPSTTDSTRGPSTRTLMRITITPATYNGPKVSDGTLLPLLVTQLGQNDLGLLLEDEIGVVFDQPPGYTPRTKTLNEGFDPYGRLIQILGTDFPSGRDETVYGMHYTDALRADEKHVKGGSEVWDIYNTTGDVHPIHFHLVDVQIIGRAPFAQDDAGNPVGGVFTPSGDFVAPDLNERGFKETVRMNPGEVTRVIMKFDLPPDPVVNVLGHNKKILVPTSPRTGGYEYVWHCHILEHEEHDMMRPLVVF